MILIEEMNRDSYSKGQQPINCRKKRTEPAPFSRSQVLKNLSSVFESILLFSYFYNAIESLILYTFLFILNLWFYQQEVEEER